MGFVDAFVYKPPYLRESLLEKQAKVFKSTLPGEKKTAKATVSRKTLQLGFV